jgi:hypothetical protein
MLVGRSFVFQSCNCNSTWSIIVSLIRSITIGFCKSRLLTICVNNLKKVFGYPKALAPTVPLAKVGREFLKVSLESYDINNRGPQGRSVELSTAELRIKKGEGTQPTKPYATQIKGRAAYDATRTPILLTSIGIIWGVTSLRHDWKHYQKWKFDKRQPVKGTPAALHWEKRGKTEGLEIREIATKQNTLQQPRLSSKAFFACWGVKLSRQAHSHSDAFEVGVNLQLTYLKACQVGVKLLGPLKPIG